MKKDVQTYKKLTGAALKMAKERAVIRLLDRTLAAIDRTQGGKA